MEEKDQYGRPYPDYAKHKSPVVAADAVVIRESKNKGQYEILMNIRGKEGSFQGCYVIPGGHVDYNEPPEKAAIRELKEETNLDGHSAELLCVRGDPKRDPRKHMISCIYLVKVDPGQEPKGGDDAAEAHFYDLKFILSQKEKIGFDHYEVILEACKKLNIQV